MKPTSQGTPYRIFQLAAVGLLLGPWAVAAQLPPRAYIAAPVARENGHLRVIEGEKEIPLETPFGIGPAPSDVAVHPLGTSVYVSDVKDNTVTVIDPVGGM